jgi:hypothetical protein
MGLSGLISILFLFLGLSDYLRYRFGANGIIQGLVIRLYFKDDFLTHLNEPICPHLPFYLSDPLLSLCAIGLGLLMADYLRRLIQDYLLKPLTWLTTKWPTRIVRAISVLLAGVILLSLYQTAAAIATSTSPNEVRSALDFWTMVTICSAMFSRLFTTNLPSPEENKKGDESRTLITKGRSEIRNINPNQWVIEVQNLRNPHQFPIFISNPRLQPEYSTWVVYTRGQIIFDQFVEHRPHGTLNIKIIYMVTATSDPQNVDRDVYNYDQIGNKEKLKAYIAGAVARMFGELIDSLAEIEKINGLVEQLLSVPVQMHPDQKASWLRSKARLQVEIDRIRSKPRQNVYKEQPLQGNHFYVHCWIEDVTIHPEYEKRLESFSEEMKEATEQAIEISKVKTDNTTKVLKEQRRLLDVLINQNMPIPEAIHISRKLVNEVGEFSPEGHQRDQSVTEDRHLLAHAVSSESDVIDAVIDETDGSNQSNEPNYEWWK